MSRGRLIGSFVVGVAIVATVIAGTALTQGPYSAAGCPRFFPATGDMTRGPRGPVPASGITGQLLVSHDRAGDVSIVDLASGATTYIEVGFSDPHEVAISSDGRWGVMSDFGDRSGRVVIPSGARNPCSLGRGAALPGRQGSLACWLGMTQRSQLPPNRHSRLLHRLCDG